MIRFLKGILAMKLEESIVLETGGIGFEIYVPAGSKFYMKNEGVEITAYTAMIVREDDMSLYGFENKTGLQIFRKLITVNGVGAKAAMAILSALPADELKKAIVFEDVAMLTKANGIGKKTAQRIVLDLKDKMDGVATDGNIIYDNNSTATMADNSEKAQAIDALVALGYSISEASASLIGVKDTDLKAEEYIKLALKKM